MRNGVLIPTPKLELIKAQLETSNVVQTKRALQDLSKDLRSGLRVHPNSRIGLEQTIVGVLGTRPDDKIRRWALNTLARFGSQSCLDAIRSTLIKFRDDPSTAAAAIAAIYGIAKEPRKLLKNLKAFEPQMLNLAALQHCSPSELETNVTVDVECAPPDILQLALILVGLNRAPPNLFDPKHSNAALVKALGTHDDPIVSQYTVWAVTENPDLGLKDLGIDIRNADCYPANVRSWIFRLIGMSENDASEHIHLLQLGINDADPEVRLGTATGLRDTFFDGLEEIVSDWICQETDPEVYQLILDHIVRQSSRCDYYARFAEELYTDAAPGSATRRRMEANAAKTKLYSKLKIISSSNGPDLFSGGNQVNNNFYGPIQAGALSVGGDATNLGDVENLYDAQVVQTLQSKFSQAQHEVKKLEIDEDLRKAILVSLSAAAANPTPGLVERALNGLKAAEEAIKRVGGVSSGISSIINAIKFIIGG